MKKLLLIVLTLFIGSVVVHANENLLKTVQIEGTDDGYNVVLQTDAIPKVSKKVISDDNIVIDVKGIVTSDAVKALYKGTTSINSLVIENVSDDETKIYVNAPNISAATILAQMSDGNAVILNEKFPIDRLLLTCLLLLVFAGTAKSIKSKVEYESSIDIKKDIKDREIQLYRNFQKELSSMPKINATINNAYATNVMPKSRRNYKELSRL